MSNYVRLRSTPSRRPTEDGRDWLDYELVIYCEKTGQNRLFVMIPEYMGDKLTGESFGRCEVSYAGYSTRRYGAGDKDTKILAARDPDQLDEGWRKLCDAYIELTADVEVEPVIAIRAEPTLSNRFNPNGATGARIDFECMRYLRVKGKPHPNRPSAYAFNDENLPLVKAFPPTGREWKIVPYDAALWDSLTALTTQINDAQARLQALVASGDIVQRLLAGRPLLQLEGNNA